MDYIHLILPEHYNKMKDAFYQNKSEYMKNQLKYIVFILSKFVVNRKAYKQLDIKDTKLQKVYDIASNTVDLYMRGSIEALYKSHNYGFPLKELEFIIEDLRALDASEANQFLAEIAFSAKVFIGRYREVTLLHMRQVDIILSLLAFDSEINKELSKNYMHLKYEIMSLIGTLNLTEVTLINGLINR